MTASQAISRDVTIGLPVFNGADNLDKTFEILTSQDYQNLVILVSDNASTDETPAIIEKWAARDCRITSYRQSENIGPVGNFDWVLSEASTDWFMFAAHDDDWSTNYVSALVARGKSESVCQLVVPKVSFTFPDERTPIVRSLDESLFQLEGTRKKLALLGAAHGSWFYGMYRRQHLLDVIGASASFPHTWGRDLVMLLPSILSGNMLGTNEAVFTHFETTLSRELYRPASAADQLALGRDFRKTALAILNEEAADRGEYLRLLIPVLGYADRHGFKLRRAVKNRIKEIFTRKPHQ